MTVCVILKKDQKTRDRDPMTAMTVSMQMQNTIRPKSFLPCTQEVR